MRRVVVVGSGVAGSAAALSAVHEAAEVTVVAGGPGASVLAGGALDDVPWEQATGEPRSLARPAERVLSAFDAYCVGDRRALVVAAAGVVRPARGRDRALLDVGALGGGRVMVADVPHGTWDARTLASGWSASWRARAVGVSFVAVAANLLARTEEHAFGDVDLAARHDDPARLAWLADRLREALATAGGAVAAVVLPPWLGVERERATELSALVGVPCGEALGGVGGPSGLRFERARDRAFAVAGVTVVAGRAVRIGFTDGAWRVELAGADGAALACDAVVLASGGFIGGGLEYTPAGATFANALPDTPRPLVRLTCDAPVRLGIRGRPLEDASSLFGGAPETHAWPYRDPSLLEQAGVLLDEEALGGQAAGAPPGLHVAGEVTAGDPRTWLAALALGVWAGRAAATADGGGPARSEAGS